MFLNLLFADIEGFADNMNRLYLEAAYATALVALLFAFLPFRRGVTRWLTSLLGMGGVVLVEELVRLNSPLPANWVILFLPAVLSVFAMWQSWRPSKQGNRHESA